MSLGHGASIATSGLILSLDSANIKSYPGSGTIWYDTSGNNNHGTLFNSPTYTSGVSGFISFDGISQYMQANIGTTALNGDPSFTIEFVAQIPQNFTNTGFWGLGGTGQGLSFEGWSPSANRIHLDLYDSTRMDPGVDYALNTWYHIVWTKNGSGVETTNIRNYINNTQSTLTKTRAVTTGPALNTSTAGVGTALGRLNGNSASFYAAVKIGLYRIYTRALSAAEVTQNFNELRGRYGL